MLNDKISKKIAKLKTEISTLSEVQLEILSEIVEKFKEGQKCDLLSKKFLDSQAFEYFSVRLAAHHASSRFALKKESFEHILEHSLRFSGHGAKLTDNKVHRGADIEVDGAYFSLKSESVEWTAAMKEKNKKPKAVTISKLMEARWIRDLSGPQDVPQRIQERVLPHFAEYDGIYILRSYVNEDGVRYEFREIPKDLLEMIGFLESSDFSPLTGAGGTAAVVKMNGRKAFRFALDGSVEKVTISGLDVELCPLHAWWELGRPG